MDLTHEAPPSAPPQLSGRTVELRDVMAFITGLRRPSGLLLEGQSGIGKTSVWHAGVARAKDLSLGTLTAYPAAAETKLPYAGLGDLFEGLDDETLGTLSETRRRALDVALLRRDAGASEGTYQRAVMAATLDVLRNLAARGPVVVAIDDVQWLDTPSAEALAFAFRRLEDQPVGLLLTARSGESKPAALENVVLVGSFTRIDLTPLTLDELDRVILEHLGDRLPLPVLVEVGRSSGGNPLFALELARALMAGHISYTPGRPLEVPTDLRVLVAERLATLPAETIELLAAVAAVPHPTRELIEQIVSGSEGSIRGAIDGALLQVRGDRLVPVHPLYGSVPLAEMATASRRDLYARASKVVGDIEERASLLAMSTDPPNEAVVRVLEEAGRHAEQRGAPGIAATLFERAAGYTAHDDIDGRVERSVAAARCFFRSNRGDRAVEIFEGAIAECVPGDRRARIMFERSLVEDLYIDEFVALLERALDEAEDPRLRAEVHCRAAWNLIATYRREQARPHVAAARRDATTAADRSLLAMAIGLEATLAYFGGEAVRRDLAEEAIELERSDGTPSSAEASPRYRWAVICLWADLLDESRSYLLELRRELVADGNEGELWLIDFSLTVLECRAGNWVDAERYAGSSDRTSELVYGNPGLCIALMAAHRGDLDVARTRASKERDAARAQGERFGEIMARSILGLAELAAGDYRAVIAHVGGLPDYLDELDHHSSDHGRFHADLAEAYVALGQMDEAKRVVDHLEALALPTRNPSGLAAVARCRGWIAIHEGLSKEGSKHLADAVELHRALHQPFELGRTLLLVGGAQRRNRMWAKARGSLTEARDIFVALGSAPWATRAERELEKIGGRAATPWALTPAEEQVANLAAMGRTNREIADELFVTVKTVEWTLSKVFRKLQIRSRTELAARPGPHESTGTGT